MAGFRATPQRTNGQLSFCVRNDLPVCRCARVLSADLSVSDDVPGSKRYLPSLLIAKTRILVRNSLLPHTRGIIMSD